MNRDQKLIIIGYALLLFHNLAFIGRGFFDDWGLGFITSYLEGIRKDYWVFFVLEVIMVITFFADMVIGYDKKKQPLRGLAVGITAALTIMFFLKFIVWYFGKLWKAFDSYSGGLY